MDESTSRYLTGLQRGDSFSLRSSCSIVCSQQRDVIKENQLDFTTLKKEKIKRFLIAFVRSFMNIPSRIWTFRNYTGHVHIYIYRGEGTNWAQKSVKFLVWSNRTWRHFTQGFTYPGGTWWSFVSFNRWPSTKDRPCFRNQIAPAGCGPIPFACTIVKGLWTELRSALGSWDLEL